MQSATKKAETLIEAVKYIKQFEGKIIIIKYGGNAMENETLKDSVLQDLSVLTQLGLQIVIVHGGGPHIDEELAKKGITKQTIDGLRVTDDKTLKVVEKVLSAVNQELVDGLAKFDVRAEDCTLGTLTTTVLDPKLGHVGDITDVHTKRLLRLLAYGIIPVISSLGQDAAGQVHNINADTAATKVAEALRAEKLTILTNTDGVLDDHGERISHLSVGQIQDYIDSGVIHGGMIPKVWACAHAVQQGVAKAHLLDGTVPRALLLEFYTDAGIGTEIVQ